MGQFPLSLRIDRCEREMMRMGSDDLYKKRRAQRIKKIGSKDPRDRILVVCEGAKTEPMYFEGFRLTNVDVRGIGHNTLSLVRKTIDIKERARKKKEPFDKVWCVFDRDSFPTQDFNEAIELASKNQIEVAYSNESFELWYCLHFGYCESAITRDQYCERLSERLNTTYDKTAKDMHDLLLDKQDAAIQER